MKNQQSIKINCLAYALRFWEHNPQYKLFYNSSHVINLPLENDYFEIANIIGFLPAEDYGYDYFSSSFAGLLDKYEEDLLKKYFQI
jgi:hypothetical protein